MNNLIFSTQVIHDFDMYRPDGVAHYPEDIEDAIRRNLTRSICEYIEDQDKFFDVSRNVTQGTTEYRLKLVVLTPDEYKELKRSSES